MTTTIQFEKQTRVVYDLSGRKQPDVFKLMKAEIASFRRNGLVFY